MDTNNLLNWYKKQLQAKQINISSLTDLSSGNIFLQLIHLYHSKSVDLSKAYFKPKNHFQVLQNYKHLLVIFSKLGWKKFDPEKYANQKQKDYRQMANYIMKSLTDFRRNSKNGFELELKNNNSLKQRTLIKQKSNKDANSIQALEQKKQILLSKIMSIEHILKEAQDVQLAKNLINKIIDQ